MSYKDTNDFTDTLVEDKTKIIHTQSSMMIYETRDYDLFVRIKGNRPLSSSKIKRIKSEIEGGLDLLANNPITVYELLKEDNGEQVMKLYPIDGQHRQAVSRLLGRPVYYTIKEKLTLVQIARLNANQERWKAKDFLNCYTENGIESYIVLSDFIRTHKFPISVSLSLLSKGFAVHDGSNDQLTEQFHNGTFIAEKQVEAEHAATIIHKFKDFAFYDSRPFIVAISRIMSAEKITTVELTKAYEANKDKLNKCSSWKSYVNNLEQIVNIGKHKRVQIY